MNSAPTMRTPSRSGPQLVLFLMVVIWAVNFSVAKWALTGLTPLAFNALRFPLAALVVWVALRRRGPIPLPERRDVRRVIAVGVIGNVVYQQLFIFGLANTRAGTASVLLAGTPIITALLSAGVGHERIGVRTWTGVLATVAGMVLVVVGGGEDVLAGGASLLGNLLMVGSAISWASSTVGGRPLVQRYGALAVTAWTLWVGAVVIVLIGIPDLVRTDLRSIEPGTWLAIAYAGAMSIGVAYLIWFHGVRQIGSTRTAVYGNLVPAVALLVAWLWLGERPTAGQLLGAAVILTGVTLAQRRARAVPVPQGARGMPP